MSSILPRVSDWLAPLPSIAPEHRGAVQAALLERAERSAVSLLAVSPFVAAFYAGLLVLRTEVRVAGALFWVAMVTVVSLGQLLGLSESLRRAPGQDPTPFRQTLRVGLGGAVWGTLPVLVQPQTPVAFLVVGLVLVGALAVDSVVFASLPRLYWAYNVGLLGVATLGLLIARVEPSLELIAFLWGAAPVGGFLARLNRSSEQRAAAMAIANAQIAAELSDRNLELAHDATHDALTGLANRASFIATLEREMADAGPRVDLGVLFIDLDRFKVVNDALGHAAGDSVLREASRRLTGQLRATDLLARLGGDEFTVLVRRAGDLESVALKILEAFTEPFEIQGRNYDVRASVGSAVAEPGMSATDVLRAADAALYLAKDEGRGRIRAFDERLRAKIDRQLDEEARLRRAIEDGAIEGWFQPIVSLRTGEIVAAETLARWRIGSRVRAAGDFLEVAEDSGLTADLSRAVGKDLRTVATEMFAGGHAIGFGLNIPPVHLSEMLSDIQAASETFDGLIVEITENGIIDDLEAAREGLRKVRERGAKVWLDDFGQGSSSLSLVTELPLDGIKIDKSFISAMFHSRAAHTVVVAITELSRSLGLDVIAEGVETREQAEALAALGVSHAQGFLISPAVTGDELLAMVASGRRWAGARGGSLVPHDDS